MAAGEIANDDAAQGTAAAHPEEMKSTIDVTIGRSVTIKAMARATPAGLISAALLMSAILIPVVLLARMRTRRVAR